VIRLPSTSAGLAAGTLNLPVVPDRHGDMLTAALNAYNIALPQNENQEPARSGK